MTIEKEIGESLADEIPRLRAKLARQRRAQDRTRQMMYDDIRIALGLGVSPTRLAKLAGVTVSRVYQIGKKSS